jgi:hypothetical protein
VADDLRVLQSQRNEILSRIKSAGLEAREFGWDHGPSTRYPTTYLDRLVHVPSGFFYEFDNVEGTSPTKHYTTHSPGYSTHTQKEFPGSWDNQLTYLSQWLSFVKRELDAPPLWEQLTQGEPLLEVPLAGAEDSPFRPEELQAIEAQLDEVRNYLRDQLPPAALPTVQAQLDRLEAAAKTTGRLSWVQMTIGLLVGLAWSGVLAPEQARTILQIIGQAFQKLITGG